jgi:hypothetical protein
MCMKIVGTVLKNKKQSSGHGDNEREREERRRTRTYRQTVAIISWTSSFRSLDDNISTIIRY